MIIYGYYLYQLLLPLPLSPLLPPSPQVFVMWSSIPLTYVFSFFFQNYLAAFGIFFCFYVFSAVAMQTIIFFTDDVNVADILHYIFLIFPGYGYASQSANLHACMCILTHRHINTCLYTYTHTYILRTQPSDWYE